MTARRRRSALYMPASNAKAIAKASELPCDVIIMDLEDAVAPDAKLMARGLASQALAARGFGDREVIVRVNGLDTEWGRADVQAIADGHPDGILLPKVNSAAELREWSALLDGRDIDLWAMVETCISLFRLEEIAAMASQSRLRGFVIGTNDLAKETGAHLDTLRTPFLGALGMAVAAARAHGLAILDGVYNDLSDDDGFIVQAKQAVAFGFDGKTLIHPRQIAPCNEAFMPDAAAVEWAREIITAFAEPQNSDKGAIQLRGRMVERLHLSQAMRTVAIAEG